MIRRTMYIRPTKYVILLSMTFCFIVVEALKMYLGSPMPFEIPFTVYLVILCVLLYIAERHNYFIFMMKSKVVINHIDRSLDLLQSFVFIGMPFAWYIIALVYPNRFRLGVGSVYTINAIAITSYFALHGIWICFSIVNGISLPLEGRYLLEIENRKWMVLILKYTAISVRFSISNESLIRNIGKFSVVEIDFLRPYFDDEPLSDLLTNKGYIVVPVKKSFRDEKLRVAGLQASGTEYRDV